MAIDGLGPGREHAGPVDSGVTVLRIVLGGQLRRLREVAGVTRDAAADLIRASHAKISRLELGRVGFKERDIADLLTLYGVTDETERAEFLGLVRQANKPGWWRRYGDVVPSWFEMLLRLEQAATIIRSYQVNFVPGLLQTEDYARAVVLSEYASESADEIDQRVTLRVTRQKLLTEPGAPQFWAVLDEAALRRRYGTARVMREQLAHLAELSTSPTVTLQVLPFDRGGLAAAGCSFVMLRFAEPDLPDVVYLEQFTGAMYLDKRAEVEQYLEAIERICVYAEPPKVTTALLRRMAAE